MAVGVVVVVVEAMVLIGVVMVVAYDRDRHRPHHFTIPSTLTALIGSAMYW